MRFFRVFQFYKKKSGVVVFQQSSRGENMMLEILASQQGEPVSVLSLSKYKQKQLKGKVCVCDFFLFLCVCVFRFWRTSPRSCWGSVCL